MGISNRTKRGSVDPWLSRVPRSGQQSEAEEEAQEEETEKHKKNSPVSLSVSVSLSLCLSLPLPPPDYIHPPNPVSVDTRLPSPPAAGLAAPGRRHALSLANGRALIAGPCQQAAHPSLSPSLPRSPSPRRSGSNPPALSRGKGRGGKGSRINARANKKKNLKQAE